MKVMSIFGTRPEMIKMWATLKKLDELNFDHIMIHTGQNYAPELKDFFGNQAELYTYEKKHSLDTTGNSIVYGNRFTFKKTKDTVSLNIYQWGDEILAKNNWGHNLKLSINLEEFDKAYLWSDNAVKSGNLRGKAYFQRAEVLKQLVDYYRSDDLDFCDQLIYDLATIDYQFAYDNRQLNAKIIQSLL